MDDVWSWAIGIAAIGIMSGLAGAGLLYMALTKGREEDPVYRDAARALAIFVFLGFTGVGLMVAASIVDRDSLDHVPGELVDILPDLIIAVLIVVAGRAVALAAGSYTAKSLSASSQRLRDQVAGLVRTVVTAGALVIALAQLGVNTTVLLIAGGALLFGVAGAAALLVGLGGREVAAEVAAGRYLVRVLHPGDRIEVAASSAGSRDGAGHLSGEVVALHPATVELRLADGSLCQVANTTVLKGSPRIIRP